MGHHQSGAPVAPMTSMVSHPDPAAAPAMGLGPGASASFMGPPGGCSPPVAANYPPGYVWPR